MSEQNQSFPFDPVVMIAEAQKRFGWKEADVSRAIEAFTPAFWAGMRHSAASPQGLQALMAALTPPGFPLAGGAGLEEGDAVLRMLFPNDAIRKAVLDQVAATTGLGRDALAEMMPVAATLVFGQTARRFAVGPARDWLDAFMAGYARGRPRPAPTPADMMAPFADAMNAFFKGFAGAAGAEAAGSQAAGSQAAGAEAAAAHADSGAEEPAASETPASPGTAFVDDLMAAGRSIQESQIRAFEKLFETFAPGSGG